jgi:serine/threonine protein kinase
MSGGGCVEPRGRLLGNRYELLVLLASGGMGRVWRARDTLLERPVAVKVLRSEFTGDATFRARFRAEAQHTAGLHHPNIASVFDYGELVEDGEQLAYLVMELVEGETLTALLEREGPLEASRTLELLRQTSAALAVAHAAGLVHRDVKPSNILMGTDGVIKITDFGIAWSASSVPLTGTGQVVGTAHYLSPEQAEGGKATPASDVYALGAVAYECLTGRRAFDGENSVQIALKQIREEPQPLPASVPAGLRRLVECAMAKDPAARFPDGAALRAAVEATPVATAPIVLPGTHQTAVLPLPLAAASAAPVRSRRRVPVPLVLGALAALLVAVLVVGLLQNGAATPSTSNTSGTPSASPTNEEAGAAPTPPPTVDVVQADLVGHPVQEVQAALVALGLPVQLVPVETADVPAGQVTAVTPEGRLAPGTGVAVSYAVAPVAAPAAPAAPVAPVGNGGPGAGAGNANNGKEKGKGKKKDG